jgi:protein-S-isoprenylcysteine O-methyltransferase Ste14
MSQLAADFTFELARPRRLVTSGVYRYMQHPSYLPDFLVTLANFALFANLDGWPACFLPSDIVALWLPWKTYGLLALAALYLSVIRIRVLEEEAMLRDTFGKEWEDWHKTTARFIPYVF